jgi:glycosyltransferase involved in cell wall biosynthesis
MSKNKFTIRSFSWGSASISWSVVIEELLYAAEQLGHQVVFLSTNGHKGMQYWTPDKSLEQEFWQRNFVREHGNFDLDLTYTCPQNFPQRFLRHSKCKAAIYAYESSHMPAHWKKFYHVVDYMLPPSQYCADMMIRNGCPTEKVVVIPHGVDTDIFYPEATPYPLKTEKKFKFLCVGEPHVRKQIDKLLKLYCETFTAKDDVCLVLKTKIFKTAEDFKERKIFEQDLTPVLRKLKERHGSSMPEIKVVSKRLKSIAGLYTACDAFVLMTASEGWGVPYLEALATGLPVIAPRHGGQLQFLNDNNAILTKCGTRRALSAEQYWGTHPKAIVGKPSPKDYATAMRAMYENPPNDLLINNGLDTARKLTWKNAIQQITDLVS